MDHLDLRSTGLLSKTEVQRLFGADWQGIWALFCSDAAGKEAVKGGVL
ncbi:MAG: hypothetical protein LBM77_04310 [Spirochaetaceae bacterium]|jgi:hypothetical protein|nr:hypothetical protein [Spirochaetaceae bacterium]